MTALHLLPGGEAPCVPARPPSSQLSLFPHIPCSFLSPACSGPTCPPHPHPRCGSRYASFRLQLPPHNEISLCFPVPKRALPGPAHLFDAGHPCHGPVAAQQLAAIGSSPLPAPGGQGGRAGGGCAAMWLFTRKSGGQEDTVNTKDIKTKAGSFLCVFVLLILTTPRMDSGEGPGLWGQQDHPMNRMYNFFQLD